MRIHFIAIGGAAMHNMAIALKLNGHDVSGSDDQIFDPSKSRLESHGLLPKEMGWHPDQISDALDVIILGMHAREDNPELLRAQELGLKIYSYPEFIYEEAKDKTRVVIAGSHGKTTITSMILHVLKKLKMDFDYLVGAQIEGFDTMVRLSDAPIIVLEGDEYLSSPIDRRPKFHWYKPQVAIISGIAWDHINVFPTFENYVDQFNIFIRQVQSDGTLIYCATDEELSNSVKNNTPESVRSIAYDTPKHRIEGGLTSLEVKGEWIPIEVFGAHNLQNMEAARLVCEAIGVSSTQFYNAIQSFKGAARRLEEIAHNTNSVAYKDFAHSPSKLKATVSAFKAQWPDRHLVACMELHTFSSLTKEFLLEYKGAMNAADTAIVFFKEETIAQKRLEPISTEEVRAAFDRKDLEVFTNSQELKERLKGVQWREKNLLMMSSGNFGGIDVDVFAKELLT